MKRFFLLWSLTCVLACAAFAQQQREFTELGIGDTIPEHIQLQFFNSDGKQGVIKDFRGKWLILDFWETYCMACIDAMPHIEKLQNKYSDQLNVLLVTKVSAETVSNFLAKSEYAGDTKLPFAVNDTLLNRLFFHRIIPHEIWINPDGVVKAITGGEELTESNVSAMLTKDTTLTLKQERKNWNTRSLDDNADSAVYYKSLLKRYDPSGPYSGGISRGNADTGTEGTINHIFYSNKTPLKMFYSLYMFWKEKTSGNMNPYRVALEFKDSTVMKRHADPSTKIPFWPRFPLYEWKDIAQYRVDNYYCYELKLPDYLPDSIAFQYAFDDLNRVFPIKARVEKRFVDCFIMKPLKSRVAAEKLLRPKDSSVTPTHKLTDTSIRIDNQNMERLTKILVNFRTYPILDETGIEGPISINIDFSDSPYLDKRQGLVVNMLQFDADKFREQLNMYGLTIVKEKRWVDILVIYDEQ